MAKRTTVEKKTVTLAHAANVRHILGEMNSAYADYIREGISAVGKLTLVVKAGASAKTDTAIREVCGLFAAQHATGKGKARGIVSDKAVANRASRYTTLCIAESRNVGCFGRIAKALSESLGAAPTENVLAAACTIVRRKGTEAAAIRAGIAKAAGAKASGKIGKGKGGKLKAARMCWGFAKGVSPDIGAAVLKILQKKFPTLGKSDEK